MRKTVPASTIMSKIAAQTIMMDNDFFFIGIPFSFYDIKIISLCLYGFNKFGNRRLPAPVSFFGAWQTAGFALRLPVIVCCRMPDSRLFLIFFVYFTPVSVITSPWCISGRSSIKSWSVLLVIVITILLSFQIFYPKAVCEMGSLLKT